MLRSSSRCCVWQMEQLVKGQQDLEQGLKQLREDLTPEDEGTAKDIGEISGVMGNEMAAAAKRMRSNIPLLKTI